MKTNIARFPVFIDSSALANEPGPSQAISVLLPGLENEEITFSEDFLILPESRPIRPALRLVVLVPENELNETELARRIWKLAAPGSLSILLLSVSSSPQTETYLRRRLATMAAMTGDEQVQVGTTLAAAKTWADAVRDVWRPGDLLVCYEGHFKANWIIRRVEIGQEISKALNAPVYFMAGLRLGPSLNHQNWPKELVTWSIAISLLIAFGWLQISIDRATDGWISTIILILTVLVEIIVLFILNGVTS